MASEVRSLAHRSATAVKEFKAIVSDNSEQVSDMTMLIDESGQTLQEIVSGCEQVMESLSQIAQLERKHPQEIEQIKIQ